MNVSSIQEAWRTFATTYDLSPEQLAQFQRYYAMVVASNQLFNLTAIEEFDSFMAYHFEDSLKLAQCYDFSKISGLVDVGTGAGFPGIPLKIKYPHLNVVLIEVTQKKVDFLHEVIEELQLSSCVVYPHDWRTFLRKTSYPADIICFRASLQPDELVRAFQPSSAYKNADIVYWASRSWTAEGKEKAFFVKLVPYSVGSKQRAYALFHAKRS